MTNSFSHRLRFPGAIFLILLALFFQSCGKRAMPAELVGTWTGTNTVTFRITEEGGRSVFKSVEFPVQIQIMQDETLEGKVGAAVFVGCHVAKSANPIMKMLGLGNEFQLSGGTLRGKISDSDPFAGKDIMVPFDLKDGKIQGTVFQILNGEKVPLIQLQLTKKP